MNIKIHKTNFSDVVAFCDKELVGKVLEDKGIKIRLSKIFYDGKDVDEKTAIEILKNANTTNIFGEKSIKVALKAGIIDKNNIKKIQGVPYAISVSF